MPVFAQLDGVPVEVLSCDPLRQTFEVQALHAEPWPYWTSGGWAYTNRARAFSGALQHIRYCPPFVPAPQPGARRSLATLAGIRVEVLYVDRETDAASVRALDCRPWLCYADGVWGSTEFGSVRFSRLEDVCVSAEVQF